MLEAEIVLTRLVRNFGFTAADRVPGYTNHITLRPTEPVLVRVSERRPIPTPGLTS